MISLCVTNFNREILLFQAIEQVLDDDRVSEIIISDDCSEYELYKRVVEHYKPFEKVKVSRNDTNIDCYRNKRKAVSLASNKAVIIWDSDNIMTRQYIDVLFKVCGNGWGSPYDHVTSLLKKYQTAFQPEFAKPHFDFRKYSGREYHIGTIMNEFSESSFTTALNAMNYFVNGEEFLRVWDGSVDPVTSDSIFQNYNWLKAGNSIFFTPGLQYEHTVHNGSHYQLNNRRTPKGFHESIVKKLKQLR